MSEDARPALQAMDGHEGTLEEKPMQPRRLIALLGIAAAMAASFGAGWRFSGQPAASASPQVMTIRLPASADRTEAAVEQPISTLRDVLQLRSDFAQTAALYALCMSLDQRGIERLLDETPKVPTEGDRRAATGILYSRLAELNPNAAVERVMRAAEFDMGALGTVFRAWARLDLQPALARAAQLEEPSKSYAIRSIIAVREDLPKAEREAIASRFKVRMTVAEARERPLDLRTAASSERAWRTALSDTDPEQRNRRLYQVIAAWARQAPETAMQAVEGLDDPRLRERLLAQAISGWAETAPDRAMDWVLAQRPSAMRAQLLQVAAQILARDKPQAVSETLNRLPPAERQRVLPQMIGSLAANDLQAALDLLPSLKDPNSRMSALWGISSRIASRDVDAALRWASTLSPNDARYVLPQVIAQLAATDPVRAAAAIGTLKDAESRDSALQNLAANWAQSDPQAAFAWAQRLPATPAQANAISNIFNQWAAYDPAAVVQQLSQLSDESQRDAAALALVSSQYVELELAEQAYRRIQNQERRQQAAMQLHYRLRETDPARAQRLLQDAGINTNYTETLRQ